MSVKINKTRLVIRNDLASKWTSKNPILLQGEMGVERDTRKFKLGDGVTNWNNLLYANVTDLSNYYTKEEIEGIKDELEKLVQDEVQDEVQAEKDRAINVETVLSKSIDTLDTKITEANNLINEVKDNMVGEEDIPKVYDWAKAETKPSYNPEEIGEHGVAALDEHGKILAGQIPDYMINGLTYGGNVTGLEWAAIYGDMLIVSLSTVAKNKLNTEEDRIILHPSRKSASQDKIDGFVVKEASELEGFYFVFNIQNTDFTWNAIGPSGYSEKIKLNAGDIIISTGSYWSKLESSDTTKESLGLDKVLNVASYSKEETDELLKKDQTPTDDSEKLITSGGVKEYVDNAKSEANSYTDSKLQEANSYTDSKSSQTLTSAKSYTDLKISQIEISGGGGSSSGSGGGIVEIDKMPNPGIGGDSIEYLFEKMIFETKCEKLYFNIGLTDEELNKVLEQRFIMYSYDYFISESMYLFEICLVNGEKNYSIDFIKGNNQEKAIFLKEFDSDWNLIREIPIWCNQEMYELSNSGDWPFKYANGIFNEKSGWYIEESLYPLEDKFLVWTSNESVGIISATPFNEKPFADSNVIYKEIKQEMTLYYNDSYYGYGVEDFKETVKRYTNGNYQLNYQKIDILDISLMKPITTNGNTINIYIYEKQLYGNNDSNLVYPYYVLNSINSIFQSYGYNYYFFDNGYFPISNKDIMKKIGEDTLYLYTSPEKKVTYKNSIGDDYVEFSTNKNPQTIQEVESLPGKTVKLGAVLPNNTPIEKIYFNFDATDEDIIPIFEKINNKYYWDGSFMGGHYVRLFNNVSICLVRCNPGENTYYYININDGASAIDRVNGENIIWASKGCNMVNSSIIDGWNPEFVEYAKDGYNLDGDTLSTSNSNITTCVELLKDIISSTPFEEKFIPDASTNQKIIYKTPDGKLSNFNGEKFVEISTSENPIAIKMVEELPNTQMVVKSGTELPIDSNQVKSIYFNFDATDKDIIPILEKMNMEVYPNDYVNDGSFMGGHVAELTSNLLSLYLYNNQYYIIGPNNSVFKTTINNIDGSGVMWASKGCNAVNSSIIDGWNPEFVEYVGNVFFPNGEYARGTTVSNYFIPLLKDIISSTPFEEKFIPNDGINSKIIFKTPDDKYHNYNGEKYIELSTSENPLAVKAVEELPETQMVEKVGTELPTDGSIPNQIHFNLEATDEDIIPILQELNYNIGSGKYDGQQMNRYSVTIVNNITDFDFDSEHSSQAINIYWYPIGSNKTKGVYLIGLYGLSGGAPSGGANRIIWASKGTVEAVNNSGNSASYKDGWQDWVVEANGIINIGGSDQYLTDNARYFIPLLKDIISSTPFEEKKYPNPDLNDQPIYKTFSSKEITNTENGFRMYFNGEDVSVGLSNSEGSDGEEVDVRFYIEKEFPTENVKPDWINGEDGNPSIVNCYLINDEIYYAWQDDNGEWVFGPDTWLLNVFGTKQYKIVNSLDNATDSGILYVVVPNENYVLENPKYFILDKTTGHKLELGSGGGSSIETVEELPYLTNEGTAVPESGVVEKIYFNTKMNPVDVANILGTLEYYDLSSVGVDFPAAVVHTSADLSTVVLIANLSVLSGNAYKSYSIIYQSSEGYKVIYEYNDSPGEEAVLDDWTGIENINVNVENMLGVLGPQFGVANQNDKVKNIISITPFENWDNINDETIYKVQKQTDGEYEKPKYVLLDKKTKTKVELNSNNNEAKTIVKEYAETIIFTQNEIDLIKENDDVLLSVLFNGINYYFKKTFYINNYVKFSTGTTHNTSVEWDELTITINLSTNIGEFKSHLLLNQQIDTTPTQGSSSPVSSGGVYDALKNVAGGLKIDRHPLGGTATFNIYNAGTVITSDGVISFEPNTVYLCTCQSSSGAKGMHASTIFFTEDTNPYFECTGRIYCAGKGVDFSITNYDSTNKTLLTNIVLTTAEQLETGNGKFDKSITFKFNKIGTLQ